MRQKGAILLAAILVLALLIVGIAVLIHTSAMPAIQAHFHGSPHAAPAAVGDGDSEAMARVRAGVAAMGRRWDETTFTETVSLYTDLHRDLEWPGLLEPETVQYGPDPQQNFDLFRPEQGFSEPGPVFVFVHGNGLGQSDWRIPESEGLLLTHAGRLGATFGGLGVLMNYRTGAAADSATGAEDLRLVVDWLKRNIADYDGDPETIVVVGHSEGASLTANYLFNAEAQPASGPGLAAAVLSSGLFGNAAPGLTDLVETYEGAPVPLALWHAEYDTPEVETAVVALRQQLCDKFQDCPWHEELAGYNHMSTLFSLGTSDTTVLSSFIRFYHTVR